MWVKSFIFGKNLRYFGESNDANPYFQEFNTKNHGFSQILHGSTHFLPLISKILLKIIIINQRLRYFVKYNDANPYVRELKFKIHCSSLFFSGFDKIFSVYQQNWVKTIIFRRNLRYFCENSDTNPYFHQFNTKNHGFSQFFAQIHKLFPIYQQNIVKNIYFRQKPTLYWGNKFCKYIFLAV